MDPISVLSMIGLLISTYIFARNQGYESGKDNGFQKGHKEGYQKGFEDGLTIKNSDAVIITNLNLEKLNNGYQYNFIANNHSYVMFNTMQLELSLLEHGVTIEWLGNQAN